MLLLLLLTLMEVNEATMRAGRAADSTLADCVTLIKPQRTDQAINVVRAPSAFATRICSFICAAARKASLRVAMIDSRLFQ